MQFLKKSILLVVWSMGMLLFPSLLVGKESKICLTMIVRNEEKIIERCLNSVKDIVDCIVICDTGSTDNTVKIIEQYIEKNKIPGEVLRHEWINFGHNRTLSVQAAQKILEKLNFSLGNTYLLLIDADMMLEIGPAFNKNALLIDSYSISQKTNAYSLYNTRLVRASLPWQSMGVTHEYWSCNMPCTEAQLQALSIDDRDDGGCKSDKFERDVKLLTQGLQQEPENERYLFYLAQSYLCLQDYDEAIKWYKKRIDKGGWLEEVWYSKYMIGECYKAMGQWDKAMAFYLNAYQFNPERAEPLYQISRYYRLKEQYNLALFFALQGSRIPYPEKQVLNISYPIYEYLFDEDISVAAYYTPHKEIGYAAANRLMLKKGVPYHVKEQAYKNMLYYVGDLKDAQYKAIDIDLPPIHEGFASHYNPMNPSIKKTSSGYDVICRTVSYLQIGAQHFKSLDLFDPTSYNTRNFLVRYDSDFNLLSQQEIIEKLPRARRKSNVEGLEDCRMFEYKNETWFACTTSDTNPTGQRQVSLCKLEANRNGPAVHVEKLIPLFGPDPFRCEKNWLPFIKNNEVHVIYSYDPLIIYKPEIDVEEGRPSRQVGLQYDNLKHDFSRFSGSAPPIEFDNGYLLLVHETMYDNSQRNYMHRFVYMDQGFNIKKVSKPFIFLHRGIEYCCGMTIDHSLTNLIMGIGIEDREAYLCTIDLDTVRTLLEPLP